MSTFITNDKYLCNTISRITCAIALFLDEVQVVANLREKIYDKQGLTSLLRCTSIGQNFQWIRNALFFIKRGTAFVRIITKILLHNGRCRIYL